MKIEILTRQILQNIPTIGAWQRAFFLRLVPLWLSLHGRFNFANLARQGGDSEPTYRAHFKRPFDFLAFNLELTDRFLGAERFIALDPSHIRKSGTRTHAVGYFYSGCAGREVWGLELTGVAGVDTEGTALHLQAVQTQPAAGQHLLDYYGEIVQTYAEQWKRLSDYVVADAYFSRQPFVDHVLQAGMHLVSRLRKDAHLRYLYAGGPTGKPGRPKVYDGRLDPRSVDTRHCELIEEDEGSWKRAYTAVVNWKCTGRVIRVVIEQQWEADWAEVKRYRLLMSTDVDQAAAAMRRMYPARYRQEHLFRDAKQFCGLDHCQARTNDKLEYHWNTALTVASLAKAARQLGDERAPAPLLHGRRARRIHQRSRRPPYISGVRHRPRRPPNPA